MRIHRVRLQNYRIHGDLSVEFDPRRTLVGGPNESGKSTLAEALHRGFFLRAKGSSAQHRALFSTTSNGSPKIELEFEIGGQTYRLCKTFGKNGDTLLEQNGRPSLRGDEAEDALAQLLKSDAQLSKSTLDSHWGHLWVRQGTAGHNPSEQTGPVARNLLQRLQSEGAGAVLMSALDQAAADGVRKFLGESVGAKGKVLAGSAIGAAHTALQAAQERRTVARSHFQSVEQSISDFHRATDELVKLAKTQAQIEKEEAAYEQRADRLSKLTPQLTASETECTLVKQRLDSLKKADADIRLTQRNIEMAEAALRPLAHEIAQFETELAHHETAYSAHAAECQRLVLQSRELKIQGELAKAHERRLEATAQRDALAQTLVQIERLTTERRTIQQELLKLPNLSEETLQQITKQNAALEKLRASLESLGVRLEWVSGSHPVTVGTDLLEAGKPVTVLEAVELAVHPDLRIRICPGSGVGITDLRRKESEAANLLDQMLRAHAVQSLDEARTAFQRRQFLEAQRGNLEAELRGLNPEQVQKSADHAERECREADALIERLSKEIPSWPVPADLNAARQSCKTLAEALRELEVQEAQAGAQRDRSDQDRDRTQKALAKRRETARTDEHAITALRSNLELLRQQSGDAETRAKGIIALEQALSGAETRRSALTREIADLAPAQLEQEHQRLQRWRSQNHSATVEWASRKSVAEGSLKVDGSRDPKADLASAEADCEAAQKAFDHHLKRLQSVELLSRLFDDAQKELNERFNRPLKEKIDGYLRHVFGHSAQSNFEFSDQGMSDISLHREQAGHSAFAFDSLSSGTKEQTAAAIRLAVAEVLAADYGGTIPVILDDAFTNSDPERVRSVIRMLDYAAERGLQVILLSCTPEDYSGLGARTVSMDRPKLSQDAPTNHTNTAALEIQGDEEGEEGDYPIPAGDDEDLKQRFLLALEEEEGSAGNKALRSRLQWDSGTYARIRDFLVKSKAVVSGRGRGGSVSLPDED